MALLFKQLLRTKELMQHTQNKNLLAKYGIHSTEMLTRRFGMQVKLAGNYLRFQNSAHWETRWLNIVRNSSSKTIHVSLIQKAKRNIFRKALKAPIKFAARKWQLLNCFLENWHRKRKSLSNNWYSRTNTDGEFSNCCIHLPKDLWNIFLRDIE